jgi:hypothetical protein
MGHAELLPCNMCGTTPKVTRTITSVDVSCHNCRTAEQGRRGVCRDTEWQARHDWNELMEYAKWVRENAAKMKEAY